MLKRIEGYFMQAGFSGPAGASHVEYHHPPGGLLPPGSNVYATISLSSQNIKEVSGSKIPPSFVMAIISEWTVYQPDGSQSKPITNDYEFTQNAISVRNCASMTFTLHTSSCDAIAQINMFFFE
jgi:hypothetical protein